MLRPAPLVRMDLDERRELLAERLRLMVLMVQRGLKSLTVPMARLVARDLTVLTAPLDRMDHMDHMGRVQRVVPPDLMERPFLTAPPFLTVPMVPLVIERIMS